VTEVRTLLLRLVWTFAASADDVMAWSIWQRRTNTGGVHAAIGTESQTPESRTTAEGLIK